MRLSIPVQIDSIKRSAADEITRCVYYRVEFEEGFLIQKTRYLANTRAFFAAGLSWAALAGPEPAGGEENLLFQTPESIAQTMDRIHANKSLSLEIGYVWVPNNLLGEGFPGEPAREGDVYRLSLPYFLHCYRFITERISYEAWLNPDRRFIRPVRPSSVETLAFRQWRQAQIEESRIRYHLPEYEPYRLAKKQEEL